MTDDRGHTVPELLVALALTSVVVLAAAQLVGEAVRLVDRTGRAMRSPTLTLAMATIRRDVQDAAGAAGPAKSGWSEGDLELIYWDGGRVRLSMEGDAVVREGIDGLGRRSRRRVLARGITSWWWRSRNPWTVDVRMTAMVTPDAKPGERAAIVRHTETRRFVMRGSPEGRAW